MHELMEESEKHDHQAFLYHYAVIEEITLNYSVQIHQSLQSVF